MAPLIFDKAMHEARKYWRDRLEAMSFDGHVALDHPRPKDEQPQPSSLEQALAPEVHALLWRLTAGNQFLSYTALVLALKICCYKYSGGRSVTIFSPATPGGAGNLLPISSALDERSSFKEALLATKDLLSSAYKHQQYPFSRMLLDMPEERRPKHPFMSASMAGFNEEAPGGPCDISVCFEMTEGGTKAALRFNGRLFDASTVQRFFEAFSGILRQGIGEMGTRIAELRPDYGSSSPVSTPDAAGVVEVEGGCIHRLIEARASEHPEGVAVVQGDRVTTYEALARHAARLAETLAGLGLDARRPIVLLMDAGTEMIVGMLAALKIGAAFAPIKLLSTRGSIARVLAALGSECVLCQRGYLADLQQVGDGLANVEHVVTVELVAASDGLSSLEITRCKGPAGARGGEPPSTTARGGGEAGGEGDVACVIVDGREDEVSKSSVTHAELARLFQWLNERCGIGAHDRCLLSPGLGVCEQLYDTLGMLMAGASVEVTDASSSRDTSRLVERLTAPEITVWDVPTPLMQNLLATLLALRAGRAGLRGPRNILLSGEKQCVSLAERLAKCFPDARITGLYSNAAVGVWTTVFPFGHGPVGSDRTAIAQAIPGFEHQILNKGGEPVPLRVKGELHLRRSLPAPDPGSPAALRSVKTGLRAEPLGGGRMRWLRGEEHCFVKYGCCVELTKVEAALCEHEHILAAEVVTVKPDQATDSSVVAFVIAEPDHVTAESARDFLLLRRVVDLIPDSFVLVSELPLTAGGAIERDVLIRRFVASHEPKDDARSVEIGEIHRQLKGIWLEALQIDDVDDDDSFFARGGNSLKATLLLARIRDEFSVDLSVQSFFREPSTRAVAQLIAAETRSSVGQQKGSAFKVVPREKYRVHLPDADR